MSDTLLIRADADEKIATGHVMRCLALASAWKAAGGKASMLSYCTSDELRRRAESAGIPFIPLRARHPDPADLATTLGTLKAVSRGSEPWLVTDGYHFDAAFQKAVRREGFRLLAIDDYGHLPEYHADILVNQNAGAETLPYKTDPDTLALLGFRYSLLRPEFMAYSGPERRVPKTARRVLVTFGGSDVDNMTGRALAAVELLDLPELQVLVVAGAAYAHFDKLKEAAARSKHRVEVVRNIPDMPGRMAWADVAVAAGGSTTWELAYMGLPAVVIPIAENQRRGAQKMAEHGLAVLLGDANPTAAAIAKALGQLCRDAELRRRASAESRRLIDGLGAWRVCGLIKALSRDSLANVATVRHAGPADVHQIWRIANDPSVRAVSFSREPIPLERHVEWYQKQLRREDSRYWVLSIADTVAAQIRYSRESADAAEVHFSVGAPFRGKGLATLALQKTFEPACAELKVRRVVGRVIAPNEASVKTFLKAGYSQEPDSVENGKSCHVFSRRSAAAKPPPLPLAGEGRGEGR